MVSKLRTTPTNSDTDSTLLGRLVGALVRLVPSSLRREITPLRGDSSQSLRRKWWRGVTEAIGDLYSVKADKSYVDQRREILSYEKAFPQPSATWTVVVPDSEGLQIMSSLVVTDDFSGFDEGVEHHLVPDEAASDARCIIYFSETVAGKVRLQLG